MLHVWYLFVYIWVILEISCTYSGPPFSIRIFDDPAVQWAAQFLRCEGLHLPEKRWRDTRLAGRCCPELKMRRNGPWEHSYWLQPFPAGWCTPPSYELVYTYRYIYHKPKSFWSYVHQASKLGHLIPLFNLDSQEVPKMGPITAIGHIFGRFHYHLLCFPAVFRQYHEAVNTGTT